MRLIPVAAVAQAIQGVLASGRPSSRRQISATAPAFPLVSSNPGATARARSTNSRTEAYCCTSATSWTAPVRGTEKVGTG